MIRLILLPAFAFAACVALSSPLDAQGQPQVRLREGRTVSDLEPGAKLRLAVQGNDPARRLEGRLRGFGATTMLLEVGGNTRELQMSSIIAADESYRDRKRGAIVGVLAALVGVYAWDFFGPHPRYTDQDKRYKENLEALAISVPVAGLIGAGIGWHRWRPIRINVR
jgi:hypothetical protein